MTRHHGMTPLRSVCSARFAFTAIIFILVVSLPTTSQASPEKNNIIGIRSGFLALDRDEFFFEYEVFISRRLTSPTEIPLGRTLSINLDGSFGSLNASGKTSVNFILGPTFQFSIIDHLLSLNIGSSAAYISEQRFGKENLGGHLQFVSHAGFVFRMTNEVGLTYRFQHMSNASLGDPNPGVDLHAVGVGYYF